MVTQRLGPDQVLLVGVELDGEPCVVALRCEVASPTVAHLRQRQFGKNAAGDAASSLVLTRIEVPPGGTKCLEQH